jgi:flagellar P-ring protein precursor FlgI
MVFAAAGPPALAQGATAASAAATAASASSPATAAAPTPASRTDEGATCIRDITHLQGLRTNELAAMSLVVGLSGTGDGKLPGTMLSLQELLHRFGLTQADITGLNAANVALVHVTVTIPENGARDGDHLDVKVSSISGAKSLKGGRLVQCPLLGPLATPRPGLIDYALASGEVVLEDPAVPTVGVVKGGAVMECDFRPSFIQNGRITLVLDRDHASFSIASAISKVINDAEAELGQTIAVADGPAQIVVQVPLAEQAAPASFISRVLELPVLMPDLRARIVINRRTGAIVITSDVRIDPVIFSLRGMTINTLSPPLVPTAAQPLAKTEHFALFAPDKNHVGASAQQLVDAFNQLQVPLDDQIAAIWELKHAGRLHAEVIEN